MREAVFILRLKNFFLALVPSSYTRSVLHTLPVRRLPVQNAGPQYDFIGGEGRKNAPFDGEADGRRTATESKGIARPPNDGIMGHTLS